MKPSTTFILAAALVAMSPQAGEPKLARGVRLLDDGKPIDIQVGHLVPVVFDWNGDGKKDLIVGHFNQGGIRLYLNRGTDAAPEFKGFTALEAGGKTIRLDAG